MIEFTLAEVAAAVQGTLHADPALVVSDVVVDSREARPGSLFVALPGTTMDGHQFVSDAFDRGASAAVVTRPTDGAAVVVDDTLRALGALASANVARVPDLRVVGITGSNGKTTTKDLLATVLGTVAPTVASPASYNGEVGLPLSALRTNAETNYLVLEYGARGIGHIAGLVRTVRPEIAVVLGVGVAHIGEFGSRAAIATAKGELVEALSADGVAVLNADDDLVTAMADRTTASVRTFGRSSRADVVAQEISVDDHGRPRFRLRAQGSDAEVALQLVGEHQVTNALAVACAALECGLPLHGVAAALSQAQPLSRWRMEVTDTGDGVTLINDAYNANPDSMAAGLRALVSVAGGRRTWAVLGTMAELGASSVDAHTAIGRTVAELGVAHAVVIGSTAAPIAEALTGTATTAHLVNDVDEAVTLLRAELAPDDVVLVKASRSAGLERVAEALVTGAVPA